MTRVAVVTGSNKGIGFEVVRQLCQKNPSWITYLTSRDTGRGKSALKELQSSGVNPKYHQLDLDSVESIKTFAGFLKREHGGVDVLVNNAGIAFENSTAPVAQQTVLTNNTNYFGWINVCKEIFPLLRDHARVVNVSSRIGQMLFGNFSDEKKKAFRDCQSVEDVSKLVKSFVTSAQEGKYESYDWTFAYGLSKLGIAVANIHQQKAFDQDSSRKDIVVNACCPGYVNTDMTSHKGTKQPSEGADTLVYLAMLLENIKEPRGTFVNERVVNDIFSRGLDLKSLQSPGSN